MPHLPLINVTLPIIIVCFIITMTTSAMNVHKNEIKVAFLGNSIIYFNDCPRLLEHMLTTRFDRVHQDSCLRGGASLPSLWTDGNGMRTRFGGSENAKRDDGTVDTGAATVHTLLAQDPTITWDYVVMNDYTQAPARTETRRETIQALDDLYGPLLASTIPILLQTAAYREVVNGSDDLGTVLEFTNNLREGYGEYSTALLKYADDVRVAPVGDAFLWVHRHNFNLWRKLFHVDDYHPSPHGTWLQACVLYCTMVREAPPPYQPEWFDTARYMQPPQDETSPLPSLEDAEELRKSACTVCDVAL